MLNQGYWAKQNRLWEEDWRRTREVYWVLYNSNVEKDGQLPRHKLIPLPSDKAIVSQKQAKPTKVQVEQANADFFGAMSMFDVSQD